ncbi:hypothetical protein [Mesorhizobium sp. 43Arga]
MASNSFSPTHAGHLEFSGPVAVYGDERNRTQGLLGIGNTLTFPFEAESYARSYADGQAFRLGVEVAERKKGA